MTTSPATQVSREVRRARLGVGLIFFTNGILLGNLAPRLPEIRDALDVTYGQIGLAMAMWPGGSLVLGLAAAALIRRFRSSRVAVIAMIACAFALLGATLSPSLVLFGAFLFAVGALDAWVDVAQNSHGLRVQKLYRRSILNGFHALWSIGAVTGGLMGGAAAGIGLAVPWHFVIVTVVAIGINVASYPLLLKGPEPVEDDAASGAAKSRTEGRPSNGRRFAVSLRTWLVLGALSLIAIAGAWAEDSASTWAASYLRDELGATVTLAALGFVALQGFQFIGRLVGDRMVDRLGQRVVAIMGGALVLVGMGLALAFPSIWGTIAGFGAAGFGVATLIPGAMHAADELPGFRAGTGLTILSWLLRLGFLLSPPVVGAIADATNLRVGLLIVPIMGLVVLLLAGVLAPRRDAGGAGDDRQDDQESNGDVVDDGPQSPVPNSADGIVPVHPPSGT